jgi:hypothetical protein
MKRIQFLNLMDIIVIDDPAQIRTLAEDPRLDRIFERKPLLNGILLDRKLGVLSFKGLPFPHMMPRQAIGRAARQEALEEWFRDKIPDIAEGPECLAPLADWIKGGNEAANPGVLAQQVIGAVFRSDYKASPESWAAALTLSKASGIQNFPGWIWWTLTGRITRAKRLLTSLAQDDLIVLHGTTVAVHNIVAAVKKMKALYADEATRRTLTPEKLARICLSPPPLIIRQATAGGKAAGCPFSKFSMFFFKLGQADNNLATKAG